MSNSNVIRLDDVGDAARALYAEQGYLAIDRVAPAGELTWLRERYDELLGGPRSGFLDGVFDLSRPYGTTEDPRLGQLLLPERLVEGLPGMETFRNIRRTVACLLEMPEDDLEMWTHLIFKAPGSDAITPWHQDEAYWDIHLEYRSVATWLPLDDVDEHNGCLWYVPGSHRREVLQHRHLGGDPNVHVLEVDEPVDTSTAQPVPLEAGGLVLHHPRCLHYAGPNGTGSIRRAWGIVFQTEPVTRPEPADRPWWHEGRAAHASKLAER